MESIRARVSFGSQEKCEKRLRQILRISRRVTAPANEAVDGRPVRLAQLRKRVFRFWYICESGLRDDAPVCRGKTGATFLEGAGGRLQHAKTTKSRVYGNTVTAVFANRTVTDCRATASVARQAKRLPYKFYPECDLLRAFFERSWFTTQMRENFAGEMERTGNEDRIRLRVPKYQRIANSWSDGGRE